MALEGKDEKAKKAAERGKESLGKCGSWWEDVSDVKFVLGHGKSGWKSENRAR